MNFNIKIQRGRSTREAFSYLCILDCSTKPALVNYRIITERSASTLIPIIRSVTRTGTIIYTDEWSSYSALSLNNNYNHGNVCHKYNFVHPVTCVHTKQVESYNNTLKLWIKK